jgi:hypothetical protein
MTILPGRNPAIRIDVSGLDQVSPNCDSADRQRVSFEARASFGDPTQKSTIAHSSGQPEGGWEVQTEVADRGAASQAWPERPA